MDQSSSLGWTSLVLAIVVGLIAALLGLRLWWERADRDPNLPAADRKHFNIQDLRRAIGISLMAFVAFGVYAGSRLPTRVVSPAPAQGETAMESHPNRHFLALWLGVLAAVVMLLALAMIDWISTRQYARRHRRELDRERFEILRDTLHQPGPGDDGLGNGRPRGSV